MYHNKILGALTDTKSLCAREYSEHGLQLGDALLMEIVGVKEV